MFDQIDEAEFVAVEKGAKAAPVQAACILKCYILRGGRHLMSVKIADAVWAEIGEDGLPPLRVSVRYAASKRLLLIRADPAGRFEPGKTVRSGTRSFFRLPLPKGFDTFKGEAAPEYYVDGVGKRILIECPEPPPPPPKVLTHAEIVARAREAVPAPEFGR